MTRTSHPSRLDHPNYTWRKVKIMKLFVMYFSPFSVTSSYYGPTKIYLEIKIDDKIIAQRIREKWRGCCTLLRSTCQEFQHQLHTGSLWCRRSQQSFNTSAHFYFSSFSLHVSAPTGHLQVRYTIGNFNGLFLKQRISCTYFIHNTWQSADTGTQHSLSSRPELYSHCKSTGK
jgi:hypothetical protein